MISGRCNIFSTIRCISEFSKNHYDIARNKVIPINQGFAIHNRQCVRLNKATSSLTFFRMASTSSDELDGKVPTSNRLAYEKSPYLLQHATNPVQWFPWGEEAFTKARQENKIIFLSIGYSTCHWCHVMERESFEDRKIAEIMNHYFVNIKVDREERPDVDQMYMTFIQNLCGHGGWPLNVFLTPDLIPITGGTYFPPEDKYGQTSFQNTLLKVASKWTDSKEDMTKFAKSYMEILQISSKGSSEVQNEEIPQAICARVCLKQLEKYYESEYGGFSGAPKFPQPVNLNFLLHMYARDPNKEWGSSSLKMCEHTLKKMANGGIRDHVGQGFARYSVDKKWHVPHFEKMLYDQGQLLQSYADAYVATKDPIFLEVIEDIAGYVTRDLRHKEGGFYSAEDADSLPDMNAKHKAEGAFYVWTYDEIKSLLNKNVTETDNVKLYKIFSHHYNVKEGGNVARNQDPHGELRGKNVLFVNGDVEATAQRFKIGVEETKNYLKEARDVLFEARSSRPRPHLDDKIITAWNGLMVSGLSRAGAASGNKRYIEYATEAAKFVEKYLYDSENKRLYRSCYRGEGDSIVHTSVKINGFNSDYAFLIKGLLDLYEAGFDTHWLELAEQLQNTADRIFWDTENAGYFSTANNDTWILVRHKDDHDGAEPSSNSVACGNLLRLAAYLDRPELKKKAESIFISFQSALTRTPLLIPEMVSALLDYHDTMTQIYITGKAESENTKALIRVVRERLVPGRVLLLVDHDQRDNILFRKSDVVGKMKSLNNLSTAYVCRHHTCSLPVTNPDQLVHLLTNKDK